MSIDTRVVTGAERLKRRLNTIRERLDLPAMTEAVGALLLRRTQTRFDREVDPDGERWAPLSSKTLKDKQRKGFTGQPILRRTGALRRSIQLIRGSVLGSIFTNTGGGIRIGVQGAPEVVTRGRAHQRGVPKRGLPQRRFLGVGSLDVKAVDSLMRRKAAEIERTQ